MSAFFTTTAGNIAAQRQAGLFEEPGGALELTDYADLVSVACGEQCPDCGSRDTEDNGHSGRWSEYRCRACSRNWGPGTEA